MTVQYTMSWSPEMASGVRLLDVGAQGLFFVLNSIFLPGVECHLDGGNCRRLGCGKILALRRYLVRKFREEERLMAENDYPDRAIHARQHSAMLVRLDRILASRDCADRMQHDIRRYTNFWAVNHILTSDRLFGLWARGGSAELRHDFSPR